MKELMSNLTDNATISLKVGTRLNAFLELYIQASERRSCRESIQRAKLFFSEKLFNDEG